MNKIDFLYNKYKYQGEDTSGFLSHYGIIGQKWGQRRWQNADGTFNEEGKIRYFGSKKATQNLTKDEIGSLYTAGQKIKNLFPQKRIGENGEEYDARYQNHYGYLTERGKRYLEKHPHDATGKLNMRLYANSMLRGAENEAEREKERLAREAKQKSDIEYINNLKSNIKTTKELKGEEISDKEFKDIIQELDNFDMRDFERNHREDYNKVADIGIDALNKAEGGWVEDDIRNDGNREWFMWEDQTIGNPELAYLYYKGYSKDYIKQYLDKVVDDESKYTDNEYSKGFFVKDEFYRGGNAYIDALYDKSEDEKVGSLNPFSKRPSNGFSNSNSNPHDEDNKNDTTNVKVYDNRYYHRKEVPYFNRTVKNDELEDYERSVKNRFPYAEIDYGSSKKSKNSNSKNNNWDYFNEAVAKLGLNNKKKLSSADWNKINKEILKLKS